MAEIFPLEKIRPKSEYDHRVVGAWEPYISMMRGPY